MIKVNDKFIIDAEDTQFIVREKKTIQDENSKKYGEDFYELYGYYGTLGGALKGIEKLMQRRAVKDNDMDIKKAIKVIEGIHKDIFDKMGE